jgi:hypothetical protein
MMTASIVSIVVAVTVVLLFAAMSSGRSCPNCDAKLPVFRKPTSLRQMLWGGWTCEVCKTEVDRSGHLMMR